MDAYLTKPIDPALMAHTLLSLMTRYPRCCVPHIESIAEGEEGGVAVDVAAATSASVGGVGAAGSGSAGGERPVSPAAALVLSNDRCYVCREGLDEGNGEEEESGAEAAAAVERLVASPAASPAAPPAVAMQLIPGCKQVFGYAAMNARTSLTYLAKWQAHEPRSPGADTIERLGAAQGVPVVLRAAGQGRGYRSAQGARAAVAPFFLPCSCCLFPAALLLLPAASSLLLPFPLLLPRSPEPRLGTRRIW
ncbi:unnamed protein product [Closterium sp. Naga37s-1]|nr:unnamed protein product [Closterium sp. Naga37s-1]